MARRRLAAIVVAAVVIFGLLLIAVIGGGAWFVMRHVAVREGTQESADHAFEEARRPFAGQHPMIEVSGDGSIANHANDASRPRRDPATTLHVLAWDPHEGRVVRVDIPFWALRLKKSMPGMSIDVPLGALSPNARGSAAAWGERSGLTIENLERYGPGLIIDAEVARGQRVLMWAD